METMNQMNFNESAGPNEGPSSSKREVDDFHHALNSLSSSNIQLRGRYGQYRHHGNEELSGAAFNVSAQRKMMPEASADEQIVKLENMDIDEDEVQRVLMQ